TAKRVGWRSAFALASRRQEGVGARLHVVLDFRFHVGTESIERELRNRLIGNAAIDAVLVDATEVAIEVALGLFVEGRGQTILIARIPGRKLSLDLAAAITDAKVEVVGRFRVRARRRRVRGEEEGVIKRVRPRYLQTLRIVAEHRELVADLVQEADVREDLVVLQHAALRTLNGRIGCCIHGVARIVLAEAIDKTRVAGREAVIVQVALEEGRADADRGDQAAVQELATILARNLRQRGVGQAVTLLEHRTACIGQRIVDRENVNRLAIELQQADFAGLTVTGAVVGEAYAQAVSVVDVPPQVGDHAITVRLGLARG